MPVTLAEAQLNTQDDVEFAIIDELRRSSWLMDQVTWDDCVNPSGGGATLTYGYTRLVTPRGAAWRAYNNEYSAEHATRSRHTVDLTPLGGTYELDRVLAHLGPRATDEMAFQVSELLTGIRTTFSTEIIRGDMSANGTQDDGSTPLGFDGLDVALAGSSTEVGADTIADWTNITTEADAHDAIEALEGMLSLLNGQPDAILTNRLGKLRLQSIGRRAGYLTESEDSFGRPLPAFAGVPIVDVGETNAAAGSAEPIIPVEARDPESSGTPVEGLTDFYAVRFGLNGFHGVSTVGPLIRQWEPDFSSAGAVKTGEVEMGPVAMVLKNTRAAAVLRNVKVAGS